MAEEGRAVGIVQGYVGILLSSRGEDGGLSLGVPPDTVQVERAGKGYVPVVIDDLAKGRAAVPPEDAFHFGTALKRHGGVTTISKADYERLLRHYGCVPQE